MNEIASLVLYHKNCMDGMGAAWAAWKKLKDSARYIPVSYGENYPQEIHYESIKTIYILDFSYDPETINHFLTCTSGERNVVLLDHHKTAKEMWDSAINTSPETFYLEIDMNRSGAGIAWDYFHGAGSRPLMIQLIEDRDLWRFKYPSTKPLHCYLTSTPKEIKEYELVNNSIMDCIAEGKAMLRQEAQIVKDIVSHSWIESAEVLGKTMYIAMVNTSSHWSEVGQALLDKWPMATFAASATLYRDHKMWSLRSRGDFDVSEVAKLHGGGGHKAASGFKQSLTKGFWA